MTAVRPRSPESIADSQAVYIPRAMAGDGLSREQAVVGGGGNFVTDSNEPALIERLRDSRRSILKKGALATGALTLGGVGTVAAQEDGDAIFGDDPDENPGELFVEAEAQKALMFRQDFVPAGLFTIVSPVIDAQPDVEEITDNIYSEYNTRTIRYVHPFTSNVPFYPAQAATIGPFEEQFGSVVDDDFVGDDDAGDFQDQDDESEILVNDEPIEADGIEENELRQLRPTVFALRREANFFGDSERIVEVQFSPVPEDQEEAVFNRFQDEAFGGGGPFGPGGMGPLDGGQTPSGTPTPTGNRTDTTGDQTDTPGS